jgi:hypothetical protein
MPLTIRDKADIAGTFRDVSIVLMETLARWVPATPELEVKTLFGRHIWDLAQHADWFGRRAAELRAALHYRRPPRTEYAAALQELAQASGTGDRVAAFYDIALTDLVARYGAFAAALDRLLDDPTLRIIERVLADAGRMAADCADVRRARPDLPPADAVWLNGLRARFGTRDWVDFRPPAPSAEILA